MPATGGRWLSLEVMEVRGAGDGAAGAVCVHVDEGGEAEPGEGGQRLQLGAMEHSGDNSSGSTTMWTHPMRLSCGLRNG